MLNNLESAAPNYFTPSIRKEASHALILARKALQNVPYHMRFGVERKIYASYTGVLSYGYGIGDAYKALKREAKLFLNCRGAADLKMSASEKQSAACERLVRYMLRIADEESSVCTEDDRFLYFKAIHHGLLSVCQHALVSPPLLKTKPSEKNYVSSIRRMMCARWWEKQVRKEHARWIKSLSIWFCSQAR